MVIHGIISSFINILLFRHNRLFLYETLKPSDDSWLNLSYQTTSNMMPKRDHERDLELDKKIEALRRKNEALMKRYKVRANSLLPEMLYVFRLSPFNSSFNVFFYLNGVYLFFPLKMFSFKWFQACNPQSFTLAKSKDFKLCWWNNAL